MRLISILSLFITTGVKSQPNSAHQSWGQQIQNMEINAGRNSSLLAKVAAYLTVTPANFFPDFMENEFQEKLEMIHHGKKTRTLSSHGNKFLVPIPLQAIWGYGCWCFFGDDLMKGQGQPVNQLDGYCKQMQLCLRCAEADGQQCPEDEDLDQEEAKCDPKAKGYTSNFSKVPNQESILADCLEANPSDYCAKNVCCCEMKFIADLLSLISSFTPFDPSFGHDNGFDYVNNCHGAPAPSPVNPGPNPGNGNGGNNPGNGNNEPKTVCCGEYPDRVSYHVGNMDCCAEDNSLFNPMSHVCCANGVGVTTIGDC